MNDITASSGEQGTHYQVTLDPIGHQLLVEVRISNVAAGELTLETPTWVPGDYSFALYARDVFDCAATDVRTGDPLPMRRAGLAGYTVQHKAGAMIVSYRASASSADFSEACGVLGDTNGVLLGTRYLRVAGASGPCRVSYVVPNGWAIHHPSGARQLGERTWEYAGYEQLLDTPVSFGKFDLITRRVRGTDFHHLFLNRGIGFEEAVEDFVDDLVKVAEVYFAMFGSFPFDDYTYVLSLNPSDGWGLEHLSSTMVGLDPATFYDSDEYKVSVRVCAHELFHAWNVRRLRPASLGHLAQALEAGSFTDGLWVAEGFTRYYEFLSCTRTGVYSPEQFFSAVTNYYTHLVALPAYARVSPADSSRATYLNHEKYPGRGNTAIDYYDAGMVIAFELDAALRTETEGQSLDLMFAAFYKHHVGQGAGYAIEDICAFAGDLLPGLGRRLMEKATLPARLDLPAQLVSLGFRVEEQNTSYLGLIMLGDVGPAICTVLDNSPAGASGLASGDVVLGVDGCPFSIEALRQAGAGGGEVALDVLRGNQPHRYMVACGTRTVLSALAWQGTARQAALIAAWLASPFAPAHGQVFSLDFYENFHGVETVI